MSTVTVRTNPYRSGKLAFCLVIAAVFFARDVAASPHCLVSGSTQACGYGCVSGHSQVRCAQTPQGVCQIGSGIVACWDPPPVLRVALGDRVPRPTCVVSSGQLACGYHCVTTFGQAACAQTPMGECGATEGKVACWDPPAAVIMARRENTPQSTCLTTFGQVSCGYACKEGNGESMCAQTPDGRCWLENGTLRCWDPPTESALWLAPGAELACIEEASGRTCGFHCLAVRNQSQCGKIRTETCRQSEDTIVCR